MKTILFILALIPSVAFGQKFMVSEVHLQEPGCSDTEYIITKDKGLYLYFKDTVIEMISKQDTFFFSVPKGYMEFNHKKFYTMTKGMETEYMLSYNIGKFITLRRTDPTGRVKFVIFDTNEVR